jgi:hypothetical protein
MKNFSSYVAEAKRSKIRPDAKHGDEPGVTDKSDNIATVNITDEKVPDSWEQNTPEQRVNTVKKLMKLNTVHGAVHMPHLKIKEEVINELSPELVGKVHKARAVGGKPSKTAAASKTLTTAVRKAWLQAKVGKMKESVGLDVTPKTPIPHVTIKKTSQPKATNAPSSASASQAAATSRSAELQKNSEREAAQKKKAAQTEIAKRKTAEKLRSSAGPKPPEAPKAKPMGAPKI